MYFIDVQGTLIDDINKEPISGAIEFINTLNEKKIPYVVITNNTKKLSSEFFSFLKNLGFNIGETNYIDPFVILKDVAKNKKVAAFGQEDFFDSLKKMGYELDYDKPQSLMVSIKKEYTNEDYSKMIECALKTDDLIGMHETSIYSKDGSRYPGVGAIMSMIKFAVNKEYKVVGKPSFNFYDEARKLIGAKNFNEITIISDDMMGDLVGAKKLGMKAILVLSGKIKDEKEVLPTLKEEEKPEFICKNMSEVLKLFTKGEL
ncbi:HAD-IIA family hydrolase [Malaciobacter mytili]|uniref:HAD family hydrolase n=1 Tax=Malaciobacter mytili LMG 24559 TaxID=1032238 RepID=A0AAX2AH86_9BACT|nr:HAD-IIA family hydrolase [Malaciobacter mytili]AXH13909.1 HAD superfamily hydrolase, subfamily IIA [Malaciobacter mytili LMG 24559]RXI43571.1 HAD family hydrolase [Malaciobacter mytili]RXK14821.1 HAD family hydrolase [Malaciobacter mytili LMG 24559]